MQRKLTVSMLNNYIHGVFEDERSLHDIVVEGEISEINMSGSRAYFTLKEGTAHLPCVCFSHSKEIPVGTLVEAFGSINYYKNNGRMSFIVKAVKPCGAGKLHLDFLKLKEKLQKEGLFEPKVALPNNALKIALVTSADGAVLHDIISVVRSKNMLVSIAVFDVRVQGDSSASEISAALNCINEKCHNIDVIIVARGGGSAADLQPFNTESVARAVAASRIPVVSAVGHETDYTLCDLCAVARAGTPSIAAEMVIRPLKEQTNRVASLLYRQYAAMASKQSAAASTVKSNSLKMLGKTELILHRQTAHLLSLCEKLYMGVTSRITLNSEKADRLSAVLERLNPLKILRQGYAKVLMGRQEISSAASVNAGDEIGIVFKDGKRTAIIK